MNKQFNRDDYYFIKLIGHKRMYIHKGFAELLIWIGEFLLVLATCVAFYFAYCMLYVLMEG